MYYTALQQEPVSSGVPQSGTDYHHQHHTGNPCYKILFLTTIETIETTFVTFYLFL